MSGAVHPNAGKLIDAAGLVDVPRLVTAYFTGKPDVGIAAQKVAFGTSGHRGSAFETAFNEDHILAITQAICLHRASKGIDGPLFIGIDSHALSTPALASALEVLAANGVEVMVDDQGGFTPTPVISHAILTYNKGRTSGLADGIVITPSHNPPADGGFKYNPPNGGPADTDVTSWMERTANELIAARLAGVRRIPYARAVASPHVHKHDFMTAYIDDLSSVLDMDAIRGAGVKIGIDPLGGAAVRYWQRIVDRFGIAATVVNETVDPTFRFMTADWDGKIRMDCSSPYAMKSLVGRRGDFDVAFANDTDADRHGIVTRSSGLMNPNHYLAVAIDYLFRHRPGWGELAGIGKTVVSSSLIDRVADRLGRRLVEVPVGFKWFVDGLMDGSLGFGGEESAGASFLRREGTAWSTDKDGIILGLLAGEITAVTGEDPGLRYGKITADLGVSYYARIDAPASAEQRQRLKAISPDRIGMTELAGEPVTATMTDAPGNRAAIGGLKVTAANGWFAVRPSGTEDVYKIYAESFRGEDHLRAIQEQARDAVTRAVAPG